MLSGHAEESRPAARNLGHANPENFDSCTSSRIRDRTVDQTHIRRRADGGRGFSLSGAERLLLQGWVKAEWKKTDTNRRARFYTLTAAGRKQLGLELTRFRQMILAISRVLEDAKEN